MTEIIENYARTSSIKQILYKFNDAAEMKKFHQFAQQRLNRELPGNYYSTEIGRKRFYQMISYVKLRSEEYYNHVCDLLQQFNFDRDWIKVFLQHFEIGNEQELRTKITDIVKAGPVNLGGGIYMDDLQVRNLNALAQRLVQDQSTENEREKKKQELLKRLEKRMQQNTIAQKALNERILQREKVIEFLKQKVSDKYIFMVRAIMCYFELYDELDLIQKIREISRRKKGGQSFEFESEGQTYAISDEDLVELEDIILLLKMHLRDNSDKKWSQQSSACLLRRIRAL